MKGRHRAALATALLGLLLGPLLAAGIAPATACTPATKGQQQTVRYQADYIFWKAV